jgi:single-stranded-DNA-specific exonuclease
VPDTLKAYRADPYSYAEARALSEALDVSEPIAVTLVRRGYRTPDEARRFLAADESHSPGDFDSMDEVVGRVLAAVREGKRITVHGDFDVDGVCATTVMVSTLRDLGADCDWLIPDRLADGYGLRAANVESLAQRGTSLLITVDCGITSAAEVRLAQELGMEVVVTDHHQPGAELPDCPILHPSLSGYPFAELCGTAVAWKLSCALRTAPGVGSPGTPRECEPGDPTPGADGEAKADADLDLVALATVADVVPLVGENRSLVRRGLEEVRRAKRPGIRALLAAAHCDPTRLDEGDLAFRLGPRINAAGRLYRADAGVELFLTPDDARAIEIASELNRANSERRTAERQVDSGAEAARRELPEELRDAPALVLAGEGWHPGVIGITASRLVERHYRPAIVISLDGEGGGRGSGRSIPGFDLLVGLEACSEHLVRFGGHRAAAGLELRAEDLDAFRSAFAAYAAEVLGPNDLRRTERIDAMVGGAALGLDLAEEIAQLAPFGMGNPGVRLLVPSARVSDVRTMGKANQHARFSLHSGAHRALGVAFGRSSLGVDDDDPVDATVRLEVNHWNGAVEPRVVLRELYPRSTAESAGEPAGWWERFEVELASDVGEWPPAGPVEGHQRLPLTSANAPAAVIGELASSGESVLAVVADAGLRAAMSFDGIELADYLELERRPDLPGGFTHVVLVDPPPFAHLEEAASRSREAGGFLHRVWGESEWRFSHHALGEQLAQRPALVATFRDLRDAGEPSGEPLLEALRGSGSRQRPPEAAARCFRVLAELGLVRGSPDGGDGTIGVVSSEGTDLERSAAFRAYTARYEEGQRYLEGRRQP